MKTAIAAVLLLAAGAASGEPIEAQLSRSKAPRDWALAAEILLMKAELDQRDALMKKAVETAPDDVLVQWLAALAPVRSGVGDPPAAGLERARKLATLEPDNAAHGLQLLAAQNAAGDAKGADETLAHMAAAKRFDEHYRDYLLAWADAWRRFPPADAELGTEVMARMAAVPFPAYQAIVKSCDPIDRPAAQAGARWKNCIAIARRMLDGRTFIARQVGYVVLQRMNELTPEDEAAWLVMRWIMDKGTELTDAQEMLDPAFGRQWLDDWRDIGREDLIFRRRLEKAKVEATPPPGWKPPALGRQNP